MSVVSGSRELSEFAIELRRLAYTVPGGQENRFVELSQRMAARARQLRAEDERRSETVRRAAP
jgi:hypothetical protein